MIRLFLLSERRWRGFLLNFPLSHGVPRVDDRRVVSRIVYVIRNGLQRKDAPPREADKLKRDESAGLDRGRRFARI